MDKLASLLILSKEQRLKYCGEQADPAWVNEGGHERVSRTVSHAPGSTEEEKDKRHMEKGKNRRTRGRTGE